MESIPSFVELIEKSIIKNWDRESLTDYKGATYNIMTWHVR